MNNFNNIQLLRLILIFTICIIAASCFQSRKFIESIPLKGKMDLLMANSFKTSIDTVQKTIYYKGLNLRQVIHKDTITWIHGLDTVFIGDTKSYEILIEIYDSSFLVISYVVGEYPYFGPGVFRRDNLVFYELISGQLYYTSTENIFIACSKECFIEQYCVNLKGKIQGSMSRVIDSIDLKNNKLILIKTNCEKEDYHLNKINKPYIII